MVQQIHGRKGHRHAVLFIALAAAVALATSVAATGISSAATPSKAKAAAAPKRGGEITYGLESETAGGWCPPTQRRAASGIMIETAIYDTLMVPNTKGKMVPYLAKSVTHDPTYMTWTITLRDGIKFHDGTPLTVEFEKAFVAPPGDLIIKSPTLEFYGVPVMHLPWFWLRSDEKLGVLPPDIAYRGKDAPTNVLSLPFREEPHDPAGAAQPRHLGDIVLAVETLQREAAEQGIPPLHHLQHLVVHGLLHLLGFDHDAEVEAEAMERLETRILATLGVPDPYAAVEDHCGQ